MASSVNQYEHLKPSKGKGAGALRPAPKEGVMLEQVVKAIFPDFYRALKFLHMDHVLRLKSRFQVVLMLSCIISLVFTCVWASDIWNMTCFRRTPWTERGLARFTCLYQLIGCIIFLFMFRHSLVALCYYDDEHEELRQKKQRALVELRQQCSEVLTRATKRASDLCEALAERLGSEIRVHVKNMRTILHGFGQSYPRELDLYEELVVAMATHLHELRRPALQQFARLIEISGDQKLVSNLAHEHRQSMIDLLAESRPDGTALSLTGRAGTVIDDDAGFGIGEISASTRISAHVHAWCSCLFGSSASVLGNQKQHLQMGLTEEDERAFWNKYRITSDDRKNAPEVVVLRPVRLVLAWLARVTMAGTGAQPTHSHMMSDLAKESHVQEMQNSPMCRSFVVGTMFCVFYLIFYAVSAQEVLALLGEGKCEYQEVSCSLAFGRKMLGLVAMACYVISMCCVIHNIDRVDKVLQATQELREMEDFKHEIDQLNAHAFATQVGGKDGAPRLTMLTDIADSLDDKSTTIQEFLQMNYGQQITLQKYHDLLTTLTDGVHSIPSSASYSSEHGHEREPLMPLGGEEP